MLFIGNRYKNNISSFVEKESINNELPKENNLNIRFGENQNLYFYKDIPKLTSFEDVNLDKKYLVKDSLIQFPWKIERETKKLGELPVRKATFHNELDNTNITAWYSPKIPFAHGPQKYWGLPGLILQLEIKYLNKNSLFKTFTFNLLNMELEKGLPIKNVNQKGVISREEYNQKIDYAMKMTEDRGVETNE
ncbi:GLPGLI family protein [Weeksellaceae bacterium TAE3-ERU29]|nr:GLPGLI family protein [Weeksellaceae bacterium TAE3-ERU29]